MTAWNAFGDGCAFPNAFFKSWRANCRVKDAASPRRVAVDFSMKNQSLTRRFAHG
jgi:hypothetical protein